VLSFQRGFVQLFRVRGVPVRAHWTVPLLCLLFSGFRVRPGLWVGILVVILAHELGHAFLVHRYGLVNLGIDLTGFGGLCRWAGTPTPMQRAAVAWGGVLAQLVILAPAAAIGLLLAGPGLNPLLAGLLEAFTQANAFLIVINLIPIRPLDGREAWPWFKMAYARFRRRREWKRKLVRPEDAEDGPLAQTLQQALDEAKRRNLH